MPETDYTEDLDAKWEREAIEAKKRLQRAENYKDPNILRKPEAPWSIITPYGVKPPGQTIDEYQQEQQNYTQVLIDPVTDAQRKDKEPGLGSKIAGTTMNTLMWLTSPLAAPSAFVLAPFAEYEYEPPAEGQNPALHFMGQQMKNFSVGAEAFMKRLFPVFGEPPEDYGKQIAERLFPDAPNWVLANAGMALEVLTDPTVVLGIGSYKTVQRGVQLTRAQIRAGLAPPEGIITSGLRDFFLIGDMTDPIEQARLYSLSKQADAGDVAAAKTLFNVLDDETYKTIAADLEIKANRQLDEKLRTAFGIEDRPFFVEEMKRLTKDVLDRRVEDELDTLSRSLYAQGKDVIEVSEELRNQAGDITKRIWDAGLTNEEIALIKNRAQVRTINYKPKKFVEYSVQDTGQLVKLIEAGELHRVVNLNKSLMSNENMGQLATELTDNFVTTWRRATRGKQSWADSMGLANKVQLEELTGRNLGDTWNAEQVFAALQSRLVVANEMDLLAIKLKVTGDPVYEVAYFQASRLMEKLVTQYRGAAAEWGRAGRAMQAGKADYMSASIKSAQEASEMIGRMTDEGIGRVAELHADTMLKSKSLGVMHRFLERAPTFERKIEDAIYEQYLNGLLSAITTTVKNLTSNTFMSLMVPFEELMKIPYGGGMDSVRTFAAMVNGWARGGKDALWFLTDTLAQGKYSGTVLPKYAKEAAAHRMLRISKEYPAQYLDPEGLAKGVATATHELDQTLRGRNISAINFGLKPESKFGKAIDTYGSFVNLPGSFLRFQDIGYKFLGYRMGVHQNAMQKAIKYGVKDKATMDRIYTHVIENPAEEVVSAGMKMADYITFQSNLSATGQKLQAAANTRVFRWFFPFVKTRTNLFKRGIERTHLGYIPAIYKLAKKDFAGAQEAAARATIGSSIITAVAASISTNNLVGHYDLRSPYGRRMHALGIRPYSIRIGDTWHTFEGIDFLKTTLGLVANYKASVAALDLEDPEDVGTLQKLGLSALAAFSKFALDPGWASEMGHLLYFYDTVASGSLNVGSSAASVIGKKMSMTLPLSRLLASFNRSFVDDEFRMANDFITGVMAELPGLSSRLPAYRDLWGEPMTASENVGPDIFHQIYRFISPFETRSVPQDMVRREIMDNPVSFPPMMREILGVTLTKQERSEVQRLTGQGVPGQPNLYSALEDMMVTRTYQQAEPTAKANMIKIVHAAYRERAKWAMVKDSMDNDPSEDSLYKQIVRKKEWKYQQINPNRRRRYR